MTRLRDLLTAFKIGKIAANAPDHPFRCGTAIFDGLMQFVEPHLGTLVVRGYPRYSDRTKNLYKIVIGTKGIVEKKRSVYHPPFVRVVFDQDSVKECKEFSGDDDNNKR